MNKHALAKQVLDVVPNAMAKIRIEWRAQAANDLSVPQLRILGSIAKGRNLIGDIAKHQGVSQPAMSMLVEAVIKKGLVSKSKTTEDKRQSPLALTKKGRAVFLKSRKLTELKLSKKIGTLNKKNQEELAKGIVLLQKIFLETL